jgi:folate-dependent phosphoribosylglycinamide formyltransferase PurN
LNELLEKEKLYTDPTLNRDDLAQRIHALEYDTYPKVIEKLLESEG